MPEVTNITKEGMSCPSCGGEIFVESSMRDEFTNPRTIRIRDTLYGQCSNGCGLTIVVSVSKEEGVAV